MSDGNIELTTLCGRPGHLCVVGDDPLGEGCFLWRTDQRLLRRVDQPLGASASLYALACDVAELYHHRRPFYLPDLPEALLEVIWLELSADDTLLVFLKPLATCALTNSSTLSQPL